MLVTSCACDRSRPSGHAQDAGEQAHPDAIGLVQGREAFGRRTSGRRAAVVTGDVGDDTDIAGRPAGEFRVHDQVVRVLVVRGVVDEVADIVERSAAWAPQQPWQVALGSTDSLTMTSEFGRRWPAPGLSRARCGHVHSHTPGRIGGRCRGARLRRGSAPRGTEAASIMESSRPSRERVPSWAWTLWRASRTVCARTKPATMMSARSTGQSGHA